MAAVMRSHALASCTAVNRQMSNGTYGKDLYMCIAMLGNTIQTVNSPMYDYIHEYSWYNNRARCHMQQHPACTLLSVPGWERNYNA